MCNFIAPFHDAIWLDFNPEWVFLFIILILFALLPCYGSLGLIYPVAISANEFSTSFHITKPDQDTNLLKFKAEQLSHKCNVRDSK